jgi:hypothetical protein
MKWIMVQIDVKTIFTFQLLSNLFQTDRKKKLFFPRGFGKISKQSKAVKKAQKRVQKCKIEHRQS